MEINVIRAVIADDNLLVRTGVRSILDDAQNVEVVGEASNGLEAIHLVETLSPDVLLLDIHMPVMDGITAMKLLRETGCEVSILILSADDDHLFEVQSMDGGASEYILKEEAPVRIVGAVQRAVQERNGKTSPGNSRK